ncbi:uncharacterized protein N7459_005094 [Penicillium hispanicum]|uniref:uncharacterized protein n=1 Tax=Penicillium hispanicum TaxID=1080232 RepID=UPI00254218CF|nr:uncharacterized protein N7459_005094 [Penicillium hispanicum]KAJ5585294.1 hypothetical protein N7459_005094 [Penicillium hispanicum]
MARQSSIDLDSPDRPFDNIINFRDVGRSINQFCGVQMLKEGVLFRSARLDDASERDKRRLAEELHIATVIDLRSPTEHQMATRKRRAENAGAGENVSDTDLTGAAVPVDAGEHLLQIPESHRALISLTGKALERSLLWKLDWFHYMYANPSAPSSPDPLVRCHSNAPLNRKVLAMAATGYRPAAVRIVGEQVMQPRGLTGLAQDTLDASMAELRAVFELLARDDAYPILVHCTQGKDRTGLVVLMTLLLAGDTVPAPAIVDDYTRSELELVPEFEERMREIRLLGLGEAYTRCPSDFVAATTEYLQSQYGGVTEYLTDIGIDAAMQKRIRQKILV